MDHIKLFKNVLNLSPQPPKDSLLGEMNQPPQTILSEILGNDVSCVGKPHPLGTILSLIDLAGGRCAALHSQGAVVTGCLDDLSVFDTPRHGDIITVTAQVVATGKASMLTSMTVEKEGGGKYQLCAKGFATFVAVHKNTMAAREVGERVDGGKFVLGGQVIGGKEILQWMKGRRKVFEERGRENVREMVERGNQMGTILQEEAVRVRKQFLPRNLNLAGVVFGGDLLELMERVACVCGGRLVKGGEVRVVGIRALSFWRPVVVENVLEVEGRVVVAGGGLLGVVVRSWVESDTGVGGGGEDRILGHSGVFHLSIEEGGMVQREGNGVRGDAEEEGHGQGDHWRIYALPLHEGVRVALRVEKGVYPTEKYMAFGEDAWTGGRHDRRNFEGGSGGGRKRDSSPSVSDM